MIDVTDVDMVKFVQKVYALSQPQGMGMMNFQPGGLTVEEAKSFIEKDGTFNLDYVKGRACKMGTFLKEGRLVINERWYDHTDAQLSQLLEHMGLNMTPGTKGDEHGPSCNCDTCRDKRGLGKLDPQEDFKKAMKAHEDGTALKIETWEV